MTEHIRKIKTPYIIPIVITHTINDLRKIFRHQCEPCQLSLPDCMPTTDKTLVPHYEELASKWICLNFINGFMLVTLKYKCLRCNHIWRPVKKVKPRICPKCKSAYWDVEGKKPER